jgi:hypothetical protein
MKQEDFTSWTIQTIRSDDGIESWLEERKFDWVAIVKNLLNKLLGSSTTVLIATDESREWFAKYIMSKINSNKQRPFMPFIEFKSIAQNRSFASLEEQELIVDMLDITFKENYTFWYIGKFDDKNAILPRVMQGSFLWLMDEEAQNSFYLSSNDKNLDSKLLQMFKLLDKSIDAALYGQIEL